MPYKTCQHVMENGQLCQSPALREKEYCYFHIEFRARRLKMARARARSEDWWLDLPCIEDLPSCEAATSRVIEGMAARVVEPKLGTALLSGLRLAASNFKARKPWIHRRSDYHNDCSQDYVSAYPDFEAVHDLPDDIDLDADPLQLFPMPQEASEHRAASHEPNDTVSSSRPATSEERMATSRFSSGAPFNPSFGLGEIPAHGAPANGEERTANSNFPAGALFGSSNCESSSVPHVRDLPLGANVGATNSHADLPANSEGRTANSADLWSHVTAEDMELTEIARRDGEEAMFKRAREIERNRRRRERRLQLARYEEMARQRNIELAARRLLADQKRAEAARAAAANAAPTAAVAQDRELAHQVEQTVTDNLHASEEQPGCKKPPLSAPTSAGNASTAEVATKPASAGGAR